MLVILLGCRQEGYVRYAMRLTDERSNKECPEEEKKKMLDAHNKFS